MCPSLSSSVPQKRYAVRRYAVRFGGFKSAGDGLEEVKEKALLNVNIFNTYI